MEKEEPKISIMNKEWRDLTLVQKIIFCLSATAFILTLGFIVLNPRELNYRMDTVKDDDGCTLTFRNGILNKTICMNNLGQEYDSPYPKGYTMKEFYDDNPNRKGKLFLENLSG